MIYKSQYKSAKKHHVAVCVNVDGFGAIIVPSVLGNVQKRPQSSGRKQVIKAGLNHPYKMIFDNGELIFTMDGALMRMKLSGQIERIAELPPGPPGSVSRFESDYVVVDNPNGRLLRVTRMGRVSVIANGLGLPNVALQEDDHFVVVDIATPVDTQIGQARLLRVSFDGRVTPIVEEGLGGPAGLYIDEDGYWVPDFLLGRLLHVQRDGVIRVVAEKLGQPLDIDFDGESFLIADFADGFQEQGVNNGRILSVKRNGKVRVLVGADRGAVGNPTGLLLRGPDIYYTDVVTNSINRLVGTRFPSCRVRGQ